MLLLKILTMKIFFFFRSSQIAGLQHKIIDAEQGKLRTRSVMSNFALRARLAGRFSGDFSKMSLSD